MRILSTITALAAFAATAMAVPALHRPMTFTQPDGSQITVMLRGDERAHCYLSEDGYLLVNDNDALYYGNVASDGRIVRSDLLAKRPDLRTDADRQFLANVDMAGVEVTMRKMSKASKFAERAAIPQVQRQSAPAKADGSNPSYGKGLFPGNHFPATGKQKGLVVLVQYKDTKFTLNDPYDYFSRLLNEKGFSDYKGTGSARDFFIDNSNGQFLPDFDVYGPITLSQNRSYYGGNDYRGDDKAPEKMAIEACQQLDATVDFSQYDRDGDGLIDNVYVFYAGGGEASGGGANSVWPHSWDVRYAGGKPYVFDGVQLANYACSNEWFSSGPDGIGTFVHEFSHVMGLPDIYATDYTGAFTPGTWCVMDQGPYNNNSRTPPAYGAFERNALGWCKPTVLTSEGASYSLGHILDTNEAYLIPTTDPNEFFLLENRQRSGWDSYIPGHGMLVWHIDYDEEVWNLNEANNDPSHQYIDIEEADGTQSESSRAGDAFPGTSGVTAFNGNTRPGMVTWAGTRLNVPIADIAETDGQITFKVGNSEYNGTFVLNEAAPEDITSTSVTVSWNALPDVSRYELHVEAIDGSYTGRYSRGRTVGTKTTASVTDLKPGKEYQIYVVPVYLYSNPTQIVFGSSSNTITVRTPDTAGIGSVTADETAEAEYFTLQGLKVDPENLTPGIYIMRQGSSTRKIVIR